MIQRFAIACCLAALAFVAFPGETQASLTPYGRGAERVLTLANERGWDAIAERLNAELIDAFGDNEAHLREWYYLLRWSVLLGTTEADARERWLSFSTRAGLSTHASEHAGAFAADAPIADSLSEPFIRYLLRSPDFAETLFTQLHPADLPPVVLRTLNAIYDTYPAAFERYRNLALAIALVHDVQPPVDWPHRQVTETALPRTLPNPLTLFDYYARLANSGQIPHDLTRLPVGSLVFLADAAPIEELSSVRVDERVGLADLPDAYARIDYSHERLERGMFIWPFANYRLKSIRDAGGICVDQAYYAAQTGKAKGIPTMIFRGAGLDGRHAWFGYLDAGSAWNFDAGRYGENQYVTGLAHNPQTWTDISDHELRFLAEAFQSSYDFRQAEMFAGIAFQLLANDHIDLALDASVKALGYERRNRLAWEAYLRALVASEATTADITDAHRAAAAAFEEYPNLFAIYTRRLATFLESSGDRAGARKQADITTAKTIADRPDLAIQLTVDEILATLEGGDVATATRLYRLAINDFGDDHGIKVFDTLARPVSFALLRLGFYDEGVAAARLARKHISTRKGSMLDAELDGLVALAERYAKRMR